jgi:glucose/arabinose dehydrogenase
MAFLPDGGILIAERGGRLRLVRNGALDPTPIAGLPQVQAAGLAGLMDVQLHPRFADNKLVYITYHKPQTPAPGGQAAPPPVEGRNGRGPALPPGIITLARGRWDGSKLVEVKDLLSTAPSGNASRIIFGRDGLLYMSVGYGDPPVGNPDPAHMPPQDPMNLAGKTLRLKDDGTVPPDNPFVGKAGYRPEIYTLGHRNILGLAVHPTSGAIWSVEHGPNGGDEVNELQPGKNYGWPVVSNGRFYLGPRVSVNPYKEGMEPPLVYWVPAIAPSGLAFYTGDKFPQWKNSLFVGGMRQGEVPRSGHLERVDFNESWEELHREGLLRDLQQRIRDVRQGPDGYLYLLTAENDAALLKLEPGVK